MPAVPKPGESVQAAVRRQNEEAKKRRVRENTAKRNKGKKAPAPAKPKVSGPLLSHGSTPVFKTGNKALDRKNTKRADAKDRQYRRNRALADYTSKTQTERQKAARDAEKRVAAGNGSERDQLVLDAHYRRTRKQTPKVGAKKVREANRKHDREVERQRRVDALKATQKKKSGGILGILEDAGEGALGVVKGAADRSGVSGVVKLVGAGNKQTLKVLDKSADGIVRAVNPSGRGSVPGAGGKTMSAGIAGKAPKLLVAPGVIAVETGKAAASDPVGVTAKTGKGLAAAIPETIAAIPQLVSDPKGAAKALGEHYGQYGFAVESDPKKRKEGAKRYRDKIVEEGAADQVLDATMLVSGGSVAAAKTAKAATKNAKPGTKSARVHEYIAKERPRLAIGDGKSVPQRKSAGIIGIAVQRNLDKRRGKRVQRELEAKQDKGKLGDSKAPQKKQNTRARENYGRGVRGVMPKAGEVVHLSAGRKGLLDRQAAAQRKHFSTIHGTASRRVNRGADEHARPAEAALAKLKPAERRAARAALEGRLNLSDPVKALAQVERALESRKKARAQLDSKKGKKAATKRDGYRGLVGDQSDNVRSLMQLRDDLKRDIETGKTTVLTPALRKVVADDRARRASFEDVAGDVLERATLKRRRVDPAAMEFGTYKTHAVERQALDQLRKVDGSVQGAIAAVNAKREKASTTTAAGKKKRRELGRVQRALEQIETEFPTQLRGKKFDEIEAKLVDRHYDRTAQAAKAAGVDDFDPSYWMHRRTDSGGLSEFTSGAGGKGKASGFKKSSMELHRLGFVDETPGAFAIGKMQAPKRAAQWQLVDEVTHDFVPKWARGDDGQGITMRQFESRVREQGLDPQDWALYQSKSTIKDLGGSDLGLTFAELQKLGADAPAWTRGKFHVVPRAVMEDMQRQAGSFARGMQRLTGGTSSVILGSNPTYAFRQLAQIAPLTAIHVGRYAFDPLTWQNFRALRKAEKDNPRVMRDLHDRFGTRSRSKDFTESPRMGALARDERKWRDGIAYDQKMLFGFDASRLLSDRKSAGVAGAVSQVGRTAIFKNPVSQILKKSRDWNLMADAWQDRLQRTLVMAVEDAKLQRRGDMAGVRADFAEVAAKDAGAAMKAIGPVSMLAHVPWEQYKKLDQDPQVRHMLEEAGNGVIKWLGDYANYSKMEQKLARSTFMFYGFVRHAGRLLGSTLPLEHPFMFAAALQAGQLADDERLALVEEYASKKVLSPPMARGMVALATGDKLTTIDTKWMNPTVGPLYDLLDGGLTGSVPIATPIVAALEARFGVSDFTGNPLTNEQGYAQWGNKLSEPDRFRVIANRIMNMAYPVRIANEILHGDKGKLADTSIPVLDPQPIKNKPGGAADKREKKKIKIAKELGPARRAAQAGVPFFPKDGRKLISAAEYEASKDKPKKPKSKKPKSMFGGSGGLF